MDDNEFDPELPPSRYLLPPGCKDLIDVLRLSEIDSAAGPESEIFDFLGSGFPVITPALVEQLAKLLPQNYTAPSAILIPDPITVADLASALGLERKYILILVLMELGRFVSLHHRLEFATAANVCRVFGVIANKAV